MSKSDLGQLLVDHFNHGSEFPYDHCAYVLRGYLQRRWRYHTEDDIADVIGVFWERCSRPTTEIREGLPSLMCVIAKRYMIDKVRPRKRNVLYVGEQAMDGGHHTPDYDDAIDAPTREEIEACVQRLPPKQALAWRLTQQMSMTRAARILGEKDANFKSNYFKAKRTMGTLLANEIAKRP